MIKMLKFINLVLFIVMASTFTMNVSANAEDINYESATMASSDETPEPDITTADSDDDSSDDTPIESDDTTDYGSGDSDSY